MVAPAARKRKPKWMTALLLASIAAWAVYIGCAMVAAFIGGDPGAVEVTLATAVFGFPVGLAASFVVGGPALLAAESLKLSHWWQAAIVGAVSGVAALALVAMFIFGMRPESLPTGKAVLAALAFGLAGACAGVTAWASLWLDGKYANRRRTDVKA